MSSTDSADRTIWYAHEFVLNCMRSTYVQVVDKNTAVTDIEEAFKSFTNRDDIAVIFICQYIAEMIRHLVDEHRKTIPAVLEIPSKDHPYDPAKVRAHSYDPTIVGGCAGQHSEPCSRHVQRGRLPMNSIIVINIFTSVIDSILARMSR